MEYMIEAENIKCGGCASTIRDALGKLEGVHSVTVDIDAGRISIAADAGLREQILAALRSSGYPEKSA